MTFIAKRDDNGQPLDGRCDVALSGITPAARFWTLTLYNLNGELVANSVKRHGFTSQEIVRNGDGSFVIVIAPRANAGNWLPTGGVERYHWRCASTTRRSASPPRRAAKSRCPPS